MHKGFLVLASLLGAVSVALGAFGAHALKKMVPPETVASFETGVRYQFYHTFALFIVAILFQNIPGKWLNAAGWMFVVGILLFSGSLYVLTAIKATNTVGLRGIGIITPIGGLFFIAGWIALLVAVASLPGLRR
jgi:uncharacterized membrane protein YgdD (TMEM256/DUF423 family)